MFIMFSATGSRIFVRDLCGGRWKADEESEIEGDSRFADVESRYVG